MNSPVRHRLMLAAAAASLVLALHARGCHAPPPAPAPGPPPDPATASARMLTAINAARSGAGLPPLRQHPALVASASGYAAVLAKAGVLDHFLGGTTPGSREAGAGYVGSSWGECLAEGQTSAQESVADWMADPPHRAILLGDYADFGGAVATWPGQAPMWVADFGKP